MNYCSFGAVPCLCALTVAPAMSDTSPSDIIGTWQTEATGQPTSDGGTAYLRLTTLFTEEKQEFLVAVYADEALEMQLFKYAYGGSWDQEAPVETPAGALAVNLVNDYSLVTIYVDAPDLCGAIDLAERPLVIGEAIDITDCVNGPPFWVTTCVDLHIVIVDQDGQRLRYGGGGVDRCVERQTEMAADEFFRME